MRSRPPAKKLPPERDPIAVAIVKARIRAGLTLQQLAERLHTDQGNIARLERSRTQATVRTLKRVGEATGHELVINFRAMYRRVSIND
jgi:transcriptional regulator with XRE-family HTH domain